MKRMPGVPIGTSRTGTIRLLFEDDRYLAVSKPPGLLVHRTPLDAHEPENLRDILRAHTATRLDPVHRLDKPTSGVILFGKDPQAIDHCKRQFEDRQADKRYLAVVRGRVDNPGCIGKPLPKGMTGTPKVARTSYVPVGHCELPYPVSRYPTARFSLMDCSPLTGRYHQIRLHFRHFRHPIIGDSQHGDKPQNRAFSAHTGTRGLLLHARRFAFDHPDGGRLILTAEVPPAWRRMEQSTTWAFSEWGEDAFERITGSASS